MRCVRWLILAVLLAVTMAMDATEPEDVKNARIEYMERGGLSAREYSDATNWDALGFYSAWEGR